jgi:hypothetical protein
MLDGLPLVDVHLHAARLPTLKQAWRDWARGFGDPAVLGRVYDEAGTVIPAAFDAYLAEEGVDIALLFAEYSPACRSWCTAGRRCFPARPTSSRIPST